ncbi:flavodoxin family protein [Candidatus Parcubacteria bacterium]|nr:flavodoxin family protein [Candidatus Parcubacteria bacterium]
MLIINGSHRKGNTDIITNKVKEELVINQIETMELVLRDIEIKLPDGCEQCANGGVCPNVKDEFSENIEPAIRDYDIYIIATPTWSDNVTPLTKIFWDRIVSWCSEDKMYLKNKKLAVITHGMANDKSWDNVINWVKSICVWEQCKFGSSLTAKSGGKVGDIELKEGKVKSFVLELIKQ